MRTSLINRTKNVVGNKKTPKVSFTDNVLNCICDCKDDHNFAISTENGKILEKGVFQERFTFDLERLEPGYYQLTVFDALDRFVFAFQVK